MTHFLPLINVNNRTYNNSHIITVTYLGNFICKLRLPHQTTLYSTIREEDSYL